MKTSIFVISLVVLMSWSSAISQEKESEHDANIYGVHIGMDVETALRSVFVNASRKPGEEKPDAMRREGKDKKDVRIVYKSLPKGELQILFENGKRVAQVTLIYSTPPVADDLRLAFTSAAPTSGDSIFNTSERGGVISSAGVNEDPIAVYSAKKAAAPESIYNAPRVGNVDRKRNDTLDGARYDDRYSIGFTDNLKQQRIWWREEKTGEGWKIRIGFTGEKQTTSSDAKFVSKIMQKTISVSPEDMKMFEKATENK